MANPSKIAAVAAIKLHLQTHGSEDWNIVLTQFPDVPSASMWRWIREAKADKPSRAELSTATARIKARMRKVHVDREDEAYEAGVTHIAKHVPAAPSPAYVAKNGAQALDGIDFSRELALLYADAMMLRSYSVKPGDDGVERIKNPVIFERQITKRTDLIETSLKMMQEIWDLQMMQGFYEAIIKEIGFESPECQRRIMDRLRLLNGRTGMTMFAEVV